MKRKLDRFSGTNSAWNKRNRIHGLCAGMTTTLLTLVENRILIPTPTQNPMHIGQFLPLYASRWTRLGENAGRQMAM